MRKLFKFLVFLLVIYILSASAFYVFTYIDDIDDNDGEFDFYKPARKFCDLVFGVPEKTNFVILGTDEDGTRTDTIISGCYNSREKTVNLMSIPRDTIVTVTDREFDRMNEEYPEPSSPVMKLNQVYHFSDDLGIVVDNIEKLIGSDIDYYCLVDFDALSYIVDEIGGVDFYVPCNMFYVDPYQDLYIELYEGQQTLFGDQAEQLLRFRSGYENADLGRISVQQDFLKEFLSQAMSRENIIGNIDSFINAFSEYVKTDMSVSKAVKYGLSAKGISGESIITSTIPGYPDFVEGISGFVVSDEDENYKNIFR